MVISLPYGLVCVKRKNLHTTEPAVLRKNVAVEHRRDYCRGFWLSWKDDLSMFASLSALLTQTLFEMRQMFFMFNPNNSTMVSSPTRC